MEWTFPISPVAASRPRVSRHGAYFTGPYKQFRKDMADLCAEIFYDWEPLEGLLSVDLELYIKQPKKTKLLVPRADNDNFEKAIWDSLNGYLWVDDTQIVENYTIKHWSEKGEEGCFIIGVSEYDFT
jgi:Holliday junction resolvase RusA-like endonuclease